jgi:flagellar protein FlaF
VYQAALKAYESVNKSTMGGRDIEAAVLTKAALKLKECQSNWDAADRFSKLDSALKFNQRVWTIFQIPSRIG